MSDDSTFHVEQPKNSVAEKVQLSHCPICNNTKFKSKLRVLDHFYSSEEFHIAECNGCGFLCTNPRPVNSILPSYYNSDAYVSHSGSKKGLLNRIYHQVQTFNFRIKYRSIPLDVPHGTWADYGAGNGGFLRYLKGKGKDVIGFEPEEDARKNAANQGMDLSPVSDFGHKNKSYSCITMWHVLEHIPDVNEVLDKLVSHLTPGGILAIAVPNYESFDAKWYREYWAAFDVPRHLWHFSEKHIIRLCQKHQIEFQYKKPMPFDSFYVSILSEGYQNKFKPKGIILGALSNLYARFSDYPYSSQIYIFKKPI